MTAHVRKIVRMGQSRGLTLPAEICRAAGIDIGSEVTVIEQNGQVTLAPVHPKRESFAARMARSKVASVRAGRALADAPSAGRE
jgi:antitoxin component of MazEF toxin-antitoxin module